MTLTSNELEMFPSTITISAKDPLLSLTAYSVFWKPTSIGTPALVYHILLDTRKSSVVTVAPHFLPLPLVTTSIKINVLLILGL